MSKSQVFVADQLILTSSLSAVGVTFVGLIYQVILSFFVVVSGHSSCSIYTLKPETKMIGVAAREASQVERLLPLRKLIALRLTTSFAAYFILSVSIFKEYELFINLIFSFSYSTAS